MRLATSSLSFVCTLYIEHTAVFAPAELEHHFTALVGIALVCKAHLVIVIVIVIFIVIVIYAPETAART